MAKRAIQAERTLTQAERDDALNINGSVQTSSYHPIWTSPWGEVCTQKTHYGPFTLGDDIWVVDPEFFGGKNAKNKPSHRTFDFTKLDAGLFAAKSDAYEGVQRRLKRIMWLYLHSVVKTPGTAQSYGDHLIRILNLVIPQLPNLLHLPNDPCPDGPQIFSKLQQRQYEEIVPLNSTRNGQRVIHELSALNREWIDDGYTFAPKSRPRKRGNTVLNGAYSDAVMTEIMRQCLNFSALTEFAIDFQKWIDGEIEKRKRGEWSCYERKGKGGISLSGGEKPQRIFKDYRDQWKVKLIEAGLLEVGGAFLYPFVSSGSKEIMTHIDSFTPTNLGTLVSSIEISHQLLLSFFTAMRDQEIYQVDLDCLKEVSGQDFVEVIGWDIKHADGVQGEQRTWPLPEKCVEIIYQQQRLMRAFYPDQTKLFSDKVISTIPQFKLNVGVPKGDQILKKMRPTSLALCLLATRSATTVQTVAGHSALTQTMGYVKSRVGIEAELVEADIWVNTIIGNRINGRVKSGEAGSKIASRVLETAARFAGSPELAERARKLVKTYNPEDFAELYEVLEDQGFVEQIGDMFNFVRPGTLCAARHSEQSSGCHPNPKKTNPANCQPDCTHRHELLRDSAFKSTNVERLLKTINRTGPEQMAYTYRLNEILKSLYGFEGNLASYKSDPRIIGSITGYADYHGEKQALANLDASARRAYKEIMEAEYA